jgi:hypothetical protein
MKVLHWASLSLILCAPLAACPARAAAEPARVGDQALRQHDNTIFRPPEGWSLGYRHDYAVLMPDDEDALGYSYMRVGLSEPAPGDASKWLQAKMKSVVEEDEKAQHQREPVSAAEGGYEVWMTGQSVDGDLQLHFAPVVGGRIQHVWFEGPADELGQKAAGAFATFVGDLKFVSAGAKPLLDSPRAGDLHGTYFGSTMGYGLNGIEVQNRFFFFSREGRFYEGVPAGRSLETLDFAAANAREGRSSGNYRVRGKKLELEFANGEKRVEEFEYGKEVIMIGGDKYWPQESIQDGTRMDGCWTSFSYASFTPGSGVVGGAGNSHSLTLRRDGSFEMEGIGFASASFETAAGDRTGGFSTNSGKNKQAGTYEFKDGVLVVTSKGKRSTKNLFMLSERVMLLDGTSYIDESKPE